MVRGRVLQKGQLFHNGRNGRDHAKQRRVFRASFCSETEQQNADPREPTSVCGCGVVFGGGGFFLCPKHIHTLAPDVHGILRGSPQNATASARARGRSGGASAAVAPAAESAISGSRPLEPACSRFSHITSQATITPTNLVFHIHFTAIVIGSHKNSAAALALALATALAVGLPDYEPLYSSSTRSHPFSAPRADCRR